MDIIYFYHSIGVEPESVIRRLMSESNVEKYLKRFPADATYAQLSSALEQQQYAKAILAAHTLKGVALSLELLPLADESRRLLGLLRETSPDTEKISAVYQLIVERIQDLQQ